MIGKNNRTAKCFAKGIRLGGGKRALTLAIGGVLLAGCMSACGTVAAPEAFPESAAAVGDSFLESAPVEAASPQVTLTGFASSRTEQTGVFSSHAASAEAPFPQASTEAAAPSLAASAEESSEFTGFTGGETTAVNYTEQFKPYEQFGLTYDADKDELQYQGKLVRWFQDYYSIGEKGAQAGTDFFNEKGVVDVYAVRDLESISRSEDGSYDPSGKLTGIKEFSEEEFAARDIDAIKNPRPVTAIAGDRMLTAKELADMAKEYEAFGVSYSARESQWYWNGEKVRFLWDVLASNGESLTGGKFKGTIRSMESESGEGMIGIYTLRDFSHPDAAGNGTLTGIEKFSQEEFEQRMRSSRGEQDSSGFCSVLPE